jgi:hypothetical protein
VNATHSAKVITAPQGDWVLTTTAITHGNQFCHGGSPTFDIPNARLARQRSGGQRCEVLAFLSVPLALPACGQSVKLPASHPGRERGPLRPPW